MKEIKSALKSGMIGLAQNRLAGNVNITDPGEHDIVHFGEHEIKRLSDLGTEALQNKQLAIISLAGGAGSRWTKGAGVVKSLHPFAKFEGKHRNFIEVHLAKNKKTSRSLKTVIPHVFTTSVSYSRSAKTFCEQSFWQWKRRSNVIWKIYWFALVSHRTRSAILLGGTISANSR